MYNFANKVVLITGASSGIGKATAELFAEHAANLVLTGRDRCNLEETANECRQKGAKDVLQVVAEFRNQIEVKSVVEMAIDRFQRLDIVINNAGVAKAGNLEDITMEDFDLMFDVNVKAMVMLTQQAMPHLVRTKGNVVNVSSVCSKYQFRNRLIYNMTKAAVDQFTKTTALEYAPKGVRVNAVNPASIMTNIIRNAGFTDEVAKKYYVDAASLHPLGRIGTADEVAKVIRFLASADSAWTTGQCFFIDGGRGLSVD